MRLHWEGRREPEVAPLALPASEPLLIQGDNLAALAGLEGRNVRLAYLDPPFMTGDVFKLARRPEAQACTVGSDAGETRVAMGAGEAPLAAGAGEPDKPAIAYRDDLPPDAYLQMLYERLVLIRRALAPDGTIVVHLDHHAAHPVKLLLDEVFDGRFLNEIVWFYQGGAMTGVRSHLPRKHDALLWYAAGPSHVFHPPRAERVSEQMKRRWGHYADAEGRVPFGKIRHEGQTHDRLRRRFLRQQGREPLDHEIAFVLQGSLLRSVWTDIPEIRNSPRYAESTGYPTQKPLALLERLIAMATDPGDRVLDPFCGSGTTLVAAQRLGRRWIGMDRGDAAIAIARQRLERESASFTVVPTGCERVLALG